MSKINSSFGYSDYRELYEQEENKKYCCNCEHWRGTLEAVDEYEKCYKHNDRGYFEYTRYDQYCDSFELDDDYSPKDLEKGKEIFEFNPKEFNLKSGEFSAENLNKAIEAFKEIQDKPIIFSEEDADKIKRVEFVVWLNQQKDVPLDVIGASSLYSAMLPMSPNLGNKLQPWLDKYYTENKSV